MSRIEQSWYKPASWITWLLSPLTLLFYSVSTLRKLSFQLGIKKVVKHDVPIIVVGNISVGGNGKTPFVIWLTEYLQSQGKNVAIVSRGYGSNAPYYPYTLSEKDKAAQVGDEPKLLFDRLGCTIVISPDRNAAFSKLAGLNIDVVISDDGLQHYQMGRDVELCIVDANRMFGNGWLMPSGPLRERQSRLDTVDLVIENGGNSVYHYTLVNAGFFRVKDNVKVGYIDEAHVVSAIGNPNRFVESLAQLGTQILSTHFFEDHHPFIERDFDKLGSGNIVMTEKDAVKCRSFAQDNWYYLKVDACANDALVNELNSILLRKGILHGV
ncbi:tetraacyldisaccharide 4'-kinase [Pseudoalteromonas xiamenensis]|uniref:tetraacyldisaccharide 4'-kinase n=1 Tax=Pseudoalteromonas xiamenensis TaxID=882626 RepID=UPI0027E46BCD|nr:tetraacyldisaccharide 4'-kinase [Pseudoalteromonas xiamenensis]WMN59908.1 tetraacyldisaccharide 4'-kinase [Pseudoalteromonas xiamenensis]